MSFWQFVWLVISAFALVAYLVAIFTIVSDLFRDRTVSGPQKAAWLLGLVFFSLLTALLYLLLRGGGMAERTARDREALRAAQEEYLRSVVGSGTEPAAQIAEGKRLLDAGALTPDEFAALKTKALA